MSKVIEKPQLTISEALQEARGKLLQFTGRSRRSEFWWCALIVFIANIVLGWIPILGSLITVVLSLLMIPLLFRRLHDSGHSGWWAGTSMILSVIQSCLIGGAIVSAFIGSSSDSSDAMETLIAAFTNPLVLIVGFVSFVLGIIILIFTIQDSKFEPNKYGLSPKYVTVDDHVMGAKAEQSDFDKGMETVGNKIDEIAEAAQEKAKDLTEKAKDIID